MIFVNREFPRRKKLGFCVPVGQRWQLGLTKNEEKMSFKARRLAGTVLFVSLFIQMQIAVNGYASRRAKIAFVSNRNNVNKDHKQIRVWVKDMGRIRSRTNRKFLCRISRLFFPRVICSWSAFNPAPASLPHKPAETAHRVPRRCACNPHTPAQP